MAAEQSPGAAVDALDIRVHYRFVGRLHYLLGAQAALPAPGAAGILAQRVAQAAHRILGFYLLDGAVVRVAVVDANGGVCTVRALLCAPATTGESAPAQD